MNVAYTSTRIICSCCSGGAAATVGPGEHCQNLFLLLWEYEWQERQLQSWLGQRGNNDAGNTASW
jgi:hypothetical protein